MTCYFLSILKTAQQIVEMFFVCMVYRYALVMEYSDNLPRDIGLQEVKLDRSLLHCFTILYITNQILPYFLKRLVPLHFAGIFRVSNIP